MPHGLVLAVLGLTCAAAGHQIWTQGRPVPLPDGPAPPFDCVSYTPFRLPGESPFDPNARVSRARVEADLTFLSTRFRCVRTYSVSQGLAQVPAVAETLGMQVLLGLWLGRDREENERELALGLSTANAHPATVRAVIVGNEVLLRRELPEEALRAYLERGAGRHAPSRHLRRRVGVLAAASLPGPDRIFRHHPHPALLGRRPRGHRASRSPRTVGL